MKYEIWLLYEARFGIEYDFDVKFDSDMKYCFACDTIGYKILFSIRIHFFVNLI